MTAILTAAEMRALEQAAIARGEVTGLELMERAGRGVVEAILAEWLGIEDGAKRAVVLCGPGNNGGDGFVVARLMRERGWEVEAFLLGDPARLPPDARANYERWVGVGPIMPLDEAAAERFRHDVRGGFGCTSLWIDAVFGIGLLRPVGDPTTSAFESIRHGFCELLAGSPGKIVAVDLPSGLDSDTGHLRFAPKKGQPRYSRQHDDGWVQHGGDRPSSARPDVQMWQAHPLYVDLTVTFQSLKVGHLLADGPSACGKVVVVDLDLPLGWQPKHVEEVVPHVRRLGKRLGHKYGYGHAVLLAGGCGKGGAARMAARGALRIGAGLVTLAVPPAALQENAGRLDAVMLRSVRDADALAELLADDRYNALGAGPGLGFGEAQGALVATVLGLKRPTVLDADALTLVARDDALRAALHGSVVLTPHEGEFKRLFPEIDARWRAPAAVGPAFSKVDAAREAAKAAGCVVLLKGPDTVVADPSGRAAINAAVYDRAAPWLATAGSGDVLAGFIAGLLARGFAPFDAACTAAWLHVECARSFGPGLVAEDLPEELPKVFRSLGL